MSLEFVTCLRSARVDPEIIMLVSSANIFAQAVLRQLGRSFI